MLKRRLPACLLVFGALLCAGVLSPSARAEVLHLGGGRFVGVTPAHGVAPSSLPGAVARAGTTSSPTTSGQLAYHGGPVVHASTPYLILWTAPGHALPTGTQALLTRYFTDVAADSGTSANVYAVGRQYSDATGFADYRQTFSSAQVITDTDPYPTRDSVNCPNSGPTYPTCVTDSQLTAEIQHEIGALHLPADGPAGTETLPSTAPIYFIVLPSDVDACNSFGSTPSCADSSGGGFCAYHSAFTDTQNGDSVLYATIPTVVLATGQNPKACQWDGNTAVQEPNGSAADVALKYLSHEHNEVITDPFGDAWWNKTSGNENGDNCNAYGSANPGGSTSPNAFAPALGGLATGSPLGSLDNQVISGDRYYLQSEWSNGHNGCDLRPPAGTLTPSFSTSANAANGSPVSFNPTASSAGAGFSSATWDFGDGATGFYRQGQALTAPSHTYAAGGTYNVSLTLVDSLGNAAATTQQISVAGPAASFSASAGGLGAAATENLPVSFDASASTDTPSTGSTLSYLWDFGDGKSATGASPTHSFVEAGTYSVTLTVTDDAGLTDSVTRQLIVADESPTVSIDPLAANQGTGLPMNFSATASDPDGSIAGYIWDFGDGTTAGGATPTHTYAAPGTYTVSLTVTDSDGQTALASQTVAVAGPAAAFAAPAPALMGTTLTFTAAAPGPQSVGTVSYDWNFGDGSQHAATQSATHSYATAGSYVVTLTETDSAGDTATASHTVTVLDEPPSAAFSVITPTPSTQQAVGFDASGSSDPDGSIAAYSWNFGDGSFGSGLSSSHQFPAAGVYTVTLTVQDSNGQTTAVSRAVTVYAPPQAAFTITGNGAPEGSQLGFNAGAAGNPGVGGPIVRYAWTFSDGTTATGVTANHLFRRPGSYPVTLTVANAVGLSNAVTQYVTIGDKAPLAAPRLLTRAPLVGSAVAFDGTPSRDADGRIVAYDWTFGDGGTATGAYPSHRYRWGAQFTVTLTVVSSDGERASQTMSVTVRVPGRVTRVQARQASGGPTLIVSVNGPGRLSVGGRRVRVRNAGSTQWHVRLSAGQLRALAAHRTIKLRMAIAFAPDAGTASRRTYTMSVRQPVHARRYTIALRG